MKAQDIMSKNPATVTPSTRVRQAALVMKKEDVGVVPVVEEGANGKRLVGVLTDRDIAIRLVADGKNADECEVRELMSANPKTARADDDVAKVMDLMGREQVRRVPIVDERGSLVGIVAQADVVLEANDDERAERTVERISEKGGKHQQ
ncbi:MAG TPA: CBS domain-containing protein [Gemmatimonadaceae bacterium]|nr:CBS domain-containing protein [Gemmatimonadaceae bacterium]